MSFENAIATVLPPPIGTLATRGAMRSVATATSAATWGLWAAQIAITSSTDATPIVLTLPAGHGLTNGTRIVVAGHTTNIAANGTWVVAAAGATSVALTGSIGSGAGAGAAGTVDFDDYTVLRPDSTVMVTFIAETNDCYIRIGTVASAGTTALNGMLLKQVTTAGEAPLHSYRFYLTPSKHTHVDILSTVSTGVLKWYISSPPVLRERI